MAELIIPAYDTYAVQSAHTAYAGACAGTGEDLEEQTALNITGQRKFTNFFHVDETHPAGETHSEWFVLNQGYMTFDTSVLDGVSVSSIEFRMWWFTGETLGAENDRLEIRKGDWSAAPSTWKTPSQFGALQLMAYRDARVTSAQEIVLDLDAGFLSNLNLVGDTEMVIHTEEYRTETAPTANNLARRPQWPESGDFVPYLYVVTVDNRSGWGVLSP